ncbi:hypothetical protein N8513_01625 [bacterium]|nr:hypothetical protein [bacterium]MDA7538092.1 hypothetical protein [Akkermansiaceae bacterium]MDA7618872.1 hypothetical protein [bacterium]MDA8960331.1 hypothetical protein [Akkermansiaceae bacterium]MDB4258564.1 hypothetical protein [Akkermansiaceae bacterium]
MKSPLLIHAVWGVVALVSFVLGSQFFGSSASGDEEVASQARNSQSVRLSSRDGDSSRSESGGGGNMGDRSAPEKVMSSADLLALADQFNKGKGPIERRLAFSKILENLTVENAQLMREQLLNLSERSDEWREFHYAWGALAGQDAVLLGRDSEERDMAATLAGWASADPASAVAWFNSLSDKEKGDNDLKWGTAFGLADTDPSAATDFAAARLAAGDRDAGRMMDVVARRLFQSGDPTEAMRWSENVPEGELQESAVRRVAEEVAEKDAPTAVSWLTTLPEGKAQERGLDRAFSEWAQDDPVAAAEELNTMSVSPARDAAINGYVSRLAWEDPVTALEWAGSVNDPQARERTMVEAGRAYMRKDGDAATAWLATSGLSEAAQKRVTERRGRDRR